MQTEPWKLIAASIAGGMSLALLAGATYLVARRHREALSAHAGTEADAPEAAAQAETHADEAVAAADGTGDTGPLAEKSAGADAASPSEPGAAAHGEEVGLAKPLVADAPATASSTTTSSIVRADPAKLTPARAVDALLDMDELGRSLVGARDPYARLRRLVRDVERREREESGAEPDAISRYLARGLREAGLLDDAADLPPSTLIRTARSRTFFLRVDDQDVAWGDVVRVLAIEGALNRALFAWEHLGGGAGADGGGRAPHGGEVDAAGREPGADVDPDPTVEDCYRFNQALASSVTAQVGTRPIGRARMSDVLGEWGVRQAISAGIESFRLPLRLDARFRVNLMGGDAAIQLSFVPAEAQAASAASDDLGRVVPLSSQMRQREATDYALRCALLLVSHAFRCSRRLCHVFVAVVSDTPSGHACLLSGDVERERFRELDLAAPFDPVRTCRALGMRLRVERDRLLEVRQGFSLDSERFCPRSRYDSVDLSSRILPRFEGQLLGAERVSDLAINENARRNEVAQELARELTTSTAANVREILDATENDRDPTVREAGRRCAEGLISGTLRDGDALALEDEFVEGDELSRACHRASGLLEHGRAHEAVDVLTDALAPVDALDVYHDTPGIAWREFTSYVGRTLYNRLLAKEGQRVRLVPDSYFGAQLLMASALIMDGRPSQALGFARRAQDLNPLDMSGTLRVVRALELLDRLEDACEELRRYLGVAFDPQGVGMSYYRLAYLEWRLGRTELADACYQKAVMSRATIAGTAMLELQTMRLTTASEEVAAEDVNDVLERAGIPLAPTDRVLEVLVEGAQAATDAEVFPVARSFAGLLGALTGDDVMHGVVNSIELDPDR